MRTNMEYGESFWKQKLAESTRVDWRVEDIPSPCGHIWHIALRYEDYLATWVAEAIQESKQLPGAAAPAKCPVCQKAKAAFLTRLSSISGLSVDESDNRLTLRVRGEAIAEIRIEGWSTASTI